MLYKVSPKIINFAPMEFRTIVKISQPPFLFAPCERVLFVGSCFADNIGKRFLTAKFRAEVNPFGVMYNPISILHTVEKIYSNFYDTAVFTLGTNHVYEERATGEIVDNCRKRPQKLFLEKELSIDECATALQKAIELLRTTNPKIKIILTVSPIRYAKYGYHESQLSKSVLLLAVHKLSKSLDTNVYYFPAYEIINDELRDYRFYKADMLHPNEQAVDYIWEQLSTHCFSEETKKFLQAWAPINAALGHRPFQPDSVEYQQFIEATKEKARKLQSKYPNLELNF